MAAQSSEQKARDSMGLTWEEWVALKEAAWTHSNRADANRRPHGPRDSLLDTDTPAFREFSARYTMNKAAALLEGMYEHRLCMCDEPGTLCRETLTPRPRHAGCKLLGVDNRAANDETWIAVGIALHSIQAELDPAEAQRAGRGLGPLGTAWVRWTKTCRKVLRDVELTAEQARLMKNRNVDGQIVSVAPQLRYTPPSVEAKLLKSSKLEQHGGFERMHNVLVPVPPAVATANAVYTGHCARLWHQMAAWRLPARQALGNLRKWAEEDTVTRERAAAKLLGSKKAAAQSQYKDWAASKDRAKLRLPEPRRFEARVSSAWKVDTVGSDTGRTETIPRSSTALLGIAHGRAQAWAVRARDGQDPWVDARRSKEYIQFLRQEEQRGLADAQERQDLSRRLFQAWSQSKDKPHWALSLLYALHASRAVDPALQVQVGEALHSVSRSLEPQWVQWVLDEGRMPRRTDTGIPTRLGKSEQARARLHTLWQGFAGSAVGLTDTQLTDITKAKRFVQAERQRAVTLMSDDPPQLPRAEREEEAMLALRRADQVAAALKDAWYTDKVTFQAADGSSAAKVPLFGEDGELDTSMEAIAAVSVGDYVNCTLSNRHVQPQFTHACRATDVSDSSNWWIVDEFDWKLRRMKLVPTLAVVSMGAGALRTRFLAAEEVEDATPDARRPLWVPLGKLCGQLVRRKDLSRSGAPILFQCPMPSSEWGLRRLRQWAREDKQRMEQEAAESQQRQQQALLAAKVQQHGARTQRRMQDARRALWALEGDKQEDFDSWLQVGAALYLIAPALPTPYELTMDSVITAQEESELAGTLPVVDVGTDSLFGDWFLWSRESTAWSRFAAQGYDDWDLHALCVDKWWGFGGRDAQGAPTGPPVHDDLDTIQWKGDEALRLLHSWASLDAAMRDSDDDDDQDDAGQSTGASDRARTLGDMVVVPALRLVRSTETSLVVSWAGDAADPKSRRPPCVVLDLQLPARHPQHRTSRAHSASAQFATVYEGAASAAVVTGLQGGRRYFLRLRLSNSRQPGTCAVFATKPSPPSKPYIVRALQTSDRHGALLRWDGAVGGPPQLDRGSWPSIQADADVQWREYLRYHLQGRCRDVECATCGSTDCECGWSTVYQGRGLHTVVGPLQPRVAYLFRVCAFNEHDQQGDWSRVSTICIPGDRPQPPTAVMIGTDRVTVKWTPLRPDPVVVPLTTASQVLRDTVSEDRHVRFSADTFSSEHDWKGDDADASDVTPEAAADSTGDADTFGDLVRAAVKALLPSEPAAPAGPDTVRNVVTWCAHFDPTVGRFYYFDPQTQETTWELPAGVAPVEHASSAVAAAVRPPSGEPPSSSDAAARERSRTTVVEPWEWVEVWDREREACYFFNMRTHESTWVPPAGLPAHGWEVHNCDRGVQAGTDAEQVPIRIEDTPSPAVQPSALAPVDQEVVDWHSVPATSRRTTEYQLQIRAKHLAPTLVYHGSNTTCIVVGLEPNQEYQFRVKADGPGERYSLPLRVLTLPMPATGLRLVRRAPGSVDLVWAYGAASTDGVSFTLDVARIPHGHDGVTPEDLTFRNVYMGNAPSYRLSGLQPGGQYVLRLSTMGLAGARSLVPQTSRPLPRARPEAVPYLIALDSDSGDAPAYYVLVMPVLGGK